MATALLVSGRMLETMAVVPGWTKEVDGVGATPDVVELDIGRKIVPVPATDVRPLLVGTAVASSSPEVVSVEDRGRLSDAIADGGTLVGSLATVLVRSRAVGRSNSSLVVAMNSSELEGIREETEGSTTAGPRLVAAGDSLATDLELGTSRLCSTELRVTSSLLMVGSSGTVVLVGEKGGVVGEGCRVSAVIWREGDGDGCRVTEMV